jgi:hypothetical protein
MRKKMKEYLINKYKKCKTRVHIYSHEDKTWKNIFIRSIELK